MIRFDPTPLVSAYVVSTELLGDSRGVFTRLHCETEFEAQGIMPRMVQTNLSRTPFRGTIRGLHFQAAPSREGKLVRCMKGRIYDVIVDLRPNSSSYRQYFSIELDDNELKGIYVPPGFAHGFQTLTADVTVLYQMTDFHRGDLSRGVRWNDPTFGVSWPLKDAFLNERDAGYPDFAPALVAGFEAY